MSNEINSRESWKIVNPNKMQKFEVGDQFVVNDVIYKIGFVSSLTGVENEEQVFITIGDDGYVDIVRSSIDAIIEHYADKGILFKVAPIGFEDGHVLYAPIYDK